MRSLLIICLAFITSVGFSQRVWDTIPNLPDLYTQRVAQFKKEPIVTGKVLFLGNSITQGGDWRKLLNDSTVINRGISGDITFGMLLRLDEVIKRKPSKVFLLIGINDISKGIPDEVIIENMFSIITRLKSGSPATEIYVQSILPLNPTFKNFPKNYNKEEHVAIINAQLQKYSERLKYTFVDLYSGFIDKDNHLDAKYSVDGLHLNAAGYAKWIAVLKEHKYL